MAIAAPTAMRAIPAIVVGDKLVPPDVDGGFIPAYTVGAYPGLRRCAGSVVVRPTTLPCASRCTTDIGYAPLAAAVTTIVNEGHVNGGSGGPRNRRTWPFLVNVHPLGPAAFSRRSAGGTATSTSGVAVASTVMNTGTVEDRPTGISAAYGQMCASARADQAPTLSVTAIRSTPRRPIGSTLPARPRTTAPQPDRHAVGSLDTLVAVRTRNLAVSCGLLALALGACGGGGGGTKLQTTGTTEGGRTQGTTHVAKAAAGVPSESAKMVCAPEAVDQIAQVIGIKTTSISKPTWINEVYSCDYIYPGNSRMTLTVREMSSVAETTAYYDGLAARLGKKQNLQGLGQGAFSTKNGSVVTRKDYKVLLVDTTKLPAKFGVPPDTRENDAINVSFTIMQCWTGA